MQRVASRVLLGVGGFLLATALLALVYVPGQVKKTPLNINSFTRLTGQAAVLPDGSASPVKALSHSVVDGKASNSSSITFNTFTCVVKDPDGNAPDCVRDDDPQDRLVTASTDRFTTDRKTALSLKDTKLAGANAQVHSGLVNKFPFGVEKKTYPFWDGLLDKAVDAKFVAAEKVNALDTYKYAISFADQPAEIVPGVQGTYSYNKTMWVDLVTGSIIKQEEHQVRKLSTGDTALDLTLAFTDATVTKNVKDAQDNARQLSIVGALPFITGVLGLLALAGGYLLLRRDLAGGDAAHGANTTRADARTV